MMCFPGLLPPNKEQNITMAQYNRLSEEVYCTMQLPYNSHVTPGPSLGLSFAT